MNYKPNLVETDVSIPESTCFVPSCPIQFVLDLIGSKWSVLILRELFQGDRRTHALLDALPGISSKTLTLRLRELEHHGLIERTVYPEIPPHVEYSITDKGRELRPVLTELKQLGERWLNQSCSCQAITKP
ncbi:helix-turn-helix domain-containing protein [Roseofilum sp. BLCC_M154]|uniref:Helix-turn-helix domain-containing protein n=1 Tax=Roseofilum acuticapitatum BLCC-M154 TaxID=3022444 RepID=A0ABT7ARI0_9CYAN|nr:helix-turn-helix domain-containing protein [Roseofilum acuticapitatum]MDJ1169514.1 helix-turn-helix domain-containing protein [Roseofilum acuticapitatum BLCC-M154]